MAFNLGQKKGQIAEINMTPFVDIVLVLLIIFMVTAPMMFSGIQLQLPKTKKVQNLKPSNELVIISMSFTGEVYIGKNKILPEEMVPLLKELLHKSKNQSVFIRAHFNVPYGKVAKLMAFLKSSGISNISLVTEVDNER